MAATAAPPVSTQLSALTAWVQAVCVEHTVDTPSDLGDGAALFEVLAGVDDVYFAAPRPCSMELLCRRLQTYYTEELGVESQRLPDIDIQAAAQSPPSQEELVKVLRLVVGLVVRSEDNNEHVNAMQSLVYDDQVTMMNIVETVLADFAQIPKEDAQDAATVSPVAPDAAQEIEALQRDLERANERCQTQHERLVAVEVELQRVQDEHQQLDQLVTSLRAAERERDTLRDKQDEWRHMAELMKKQDRQLDTLRTRAEEAAELRRQVRELESANTELSNSAGVAAERSASDVMDKHRSAIRASERRLTELQEAHETVCKERDELESRCEKLEEQRRTDQEQLQTLLERVQSMELEQGMHSVSLAEEISETSSAMPRQANASVDPRQADLDTVRPSSSAHAILAAALSDTKTMQEQVRSKEAEARGRLSQMEGKLDKGDAELLANLVTEPCAQYDLLYKHLQACLMALEKSEPYTIPESEKMERECTALRQELALMASAYQKLSLQIYMEANGVAVENSSYVVPEQPQPPSQSTSWLSRQRGAFAHALSLSKNS